MLWVINNVTLWSPAEWENLLLCRFGLHPEQLNMSPCHRQDFISPPPGPARFSEVLQEI